jgi:hypothetical protein
MVDVRERLVVSVFFEEFKDSVPNGIRCRSVIKAVYEDLNIPDLVAVRRSLGRVDYEKDTGFGGRVPND